VAYFFRTKALHERASRVPRLEQNCLNRSPLATYFEHLAHENTAKSRASLVEGDQIAEVLGLEEELIDGLLVGLISPFGPEALRIRLCEGARSVAMIRYRAFAERIGPRSRRATRHIAVSSASVLLS
jgi:hypothetical protein